MRRFIIATNKSDLQLTNCKVIEMDIADLAVMFNQDTLNVLNENEYKQLLTSTNLYGVEVEFDNYLTGYRKFLKEVNEFDSDIIAIYDVSIRRYINYHELSYFANNKLLPSKLFNIEIVTNDNRCTYTTIGLQSIGLKEFEFKSNMYLNEEDFQIFKGVVTNYIIGKAAKVNINSQNVNYSLIENDNMMSFNYVRPSRIYEFYVRDDMYLTKIRYDLIEYHWEVFKKLYKNNPELGNYVINKSPTYDLENFEVKHVEEFTIVTEDINYNQDNLFYAYKYL
ncbi:hypothetical protein R2F61_00785 [Mollicutes bacterium LVI A0078]|nr:hypothetical protein RZE84_00790 [Mollicutes bacterium LVI A0075]WOO91117.1 hypothetical protein R2F61_00785 [Mollicutes bacterium LVI A0078]